MPEQPTSSELLVRYVRQALEQIERGEPVDPAALCREHPECAAPLAEALGLADQLQTLAAPAVRGDPLAGMLLAGRYRLEHCLGRGAMGVVYRAADAELRRAVAVKILDARLFVDPTAEQRFRREAEALAALDHPHVVAVFDRGRSAEGIHFLVMELLEGATLAAVLDAVGDGAGEGGDEAARAAAAAARLGQPLPEGGWWRQCARWGAELADGLAAAHALGMVHRDVKPSNAFVRRDGRALLLDFGIAARGDDARLTATATALGTPSYMAPEQARGGAGASPALDVYGLGACLYHLLSGRPPYEGEPTAVLAALQQRDPLPLRRLRPQLPRDLAAIVERAMEREPRRRYPTAALLAADLRAFLEHRPVQARPIGWAGRRWRGMRRHPARAVATLAAAVLLVLLPLFFVQQAREALRLELQQRQARLHDLDAQLPSLLAVEGQPGQRLVEVLLPDQQQATRLLDEMLALDPEHLPCRLFRGAMRLDAGDRDGAAADLQAIAHSQQSRYLAALAQRYLAVAPSGRGTESVDLQGLPPPDGPAAQFVAGFHELRNRQVAGFAERARALLTAAKSSYVPARDLRLIALLASSDALRGEARAAVFREVQEEAIRLEEVYGQNTARTRAMLGAALVGLQRYDEAIAPLRESLRLRPDRHGPLINLGIALRRTGDLDAAAAALQRAYELRPEYWNTRFTLAQVERDRGDFAAARQWAATLPQQGNGLEWKQPELCGSIAVAEAVQLRGAVSAPMRAAAQRAVADFDRALAAVGPGPVQDRLQVQRQIAVALQEQDMRTAASEFLRALGADPDNAVHLANLAAFLPLEGLDATLTLQFGIFLRQLAMALVPGDQGLQRRLLAEIEQMQQRAGEGGGHEGRR